MKVYLARDEWWPVYSVTDEPWETRCVEISEATKIRWEQAEAQFTEVQNEINKILDEQAK